MRSSPLLLSELDRTSSPFSPHECTRKSSRQSILRFMSPPSASRKASRFFRTASMHGAIDPDASRQKTTSTTPFVLVAIFVPRAKPLAASVGHGHVRRLLGHRLRQE